MLRIGLKASLEIISVRPLKQIASECLGTRLTVYSRGHLLGPTLRLLKETKENGALGLPKKKSLQQSCSGVWGRRDGR
jgi:hypothetical protein